MPEATRRCPYCGNAITNPRRVQCGAPECKRRYRNERQRAFQRQHRVTTGERYANRYPATPRTIEIACAHCGLQGTVTKPSAKYCSTRCWYDAKHAAHSQVVLWSARRQSLRVPLITVLKPARRCWYSVRCPMCRTWFVTDNPKHQSCSPRCGRRIAKDRERAQRRNAFVAPVSRIQVYERDRWICQLCRKPVMADKVVPHPKAPTLDHIVPLSRGGTHEPSNVQLAHFHCNTIKNNGVWGTGEQLTLIG